MPNIRLRFVGGTSLVSDIIRKFEDGFWATHVEAVLLDGQHVLGAYLGLGVAIRPLGYDAGQFDREEFVDLPATQEQFDQFWAFLHAQVGKPYDDKAVLGIAMQRDWQSPDSWFCAEIDASALCKCGIFPAHLATSLNHVTPRDLLLIVSGRVPVDEPLVA